MSKLYAWRNGEEDRVTISNGCPSLFIDGSYRRSGCFTLTLEAFSQISDGIVPGPHSLWSVELTLNWKCVSGLSERLKQIVDPETLEVQQLEQISQTNEALSAIAGAVGPKPKTLKWEYMNTDTFDLTQNLGADGWELVTVLFDPTRRPCFYLKRQLKEQS